MVYQDINNPFSSDHKKNNPTQYFASVFDRFLSAVLDYFIFSPIVAFAILIFFKDSVLILKSNSSWLEAQGLFLQVGFFSLLLFSFFLTLSIFITGSTPGQKFLKLFIYFEHKSSSLFFQIWYRQIGFCLSVLFLGLPFVAIIYHDKHRAWYDRLSESDVMTFKYALVGQTEPGLFAISRVEKRYFSISISVIIGFVFSALMLSVIQANQVTVEKVQFALTDTTKKTSVINKKCELNNDQDQIDRIKTAIALNILNLTPDECVLSAADEFFSQMTEKLIYDEKQILKKTQSLAYFAKYYVSQKSKKNLDYLNKACAVDVTTELCEAVNRRSLASEGETSTDLSQKIIMILGSHK